MSHTPNTDAWHADTRAVWDWLCADPHRAAFWRSLAMTFRMNKAAAAKDLGWRYAQREGYIYPDCDWAAIVEALYRYSLAGHELEALRG